MLEKARSLLGSKHNKDLIERIGTFKLSCVEIDNLAIIVNKIKANMYQLLIVKDIK